MDVFFNNVSSRSSTIHIHISYILFLEWFYNIFFEIEIFYVIFFRKKSVEFILYIFFVVSERMLRNEATVEEKGQ